LRKIKKNLKRTKRREREVAKGNTEFTKVVKETIEEGKEKGETKFRYSYSIGYQPYSTP
jgi:hypothetical protein